MKLNDQRKQRLKKLESLTAGEARRASYTLTNSRLKTIFDSSGFSAEGTLISASAAPHRGTDRLETRFGPGKDKIATLKAVGLPLVELRTGGRTEKKREKESERERDRERERERQRARQRQTDRQTR